MSMRNHWVEIECSSLKNDYATGPRGKNDDMNITLFQDNCNNSEKVLRIRCYPTYVPEEKKTYITTTVTNCLTNEVIFSYETTR